MRHLLQHIGCLAFKFFRFAAFALRWETNHIAVLLEDDGPAASRADEFEVGISRRNHRNLTAHQDTAATPPPIPPATPPD